MEEADFNELILNNMPSFVAVNYQRLLEAQQPQERVRLIVHLYDLLLRMLTIALVSQYLENNKEDRVNDPYLNRLLLDRFPTDLTVDLWQKILFSAFEVYEGKVNLFFMSELYDFYWNTSTEPHSRRLEVKQNIERLTQIAVEIQLGKQLPQDEAGWSTRAQESMGFLKSILNELSFMGRYELIRVLDSDETSYRFELHRGINTAHGPCSLPNHPKLKRYLRDGKVPPGFYLRKGTEAVLRVHPFLMEQEKLVPPDTGIYDHLIYGVELEYLLSRSGKTKLDNETTVKEFLMLLDALKEIKRQRQGREAEKLSWMELVETCTNITDGRMATVLDTYKEELYLQRDKTRQEFERFMESEKKRCFVLIGASGVGKSTFLLTASDELRKSRSDVCILMYDGAYVKPTLTEFIKQDFEWRERPVHDIWREIARVEGIQGRLVLLCVDAINENPNPKGLLEELDGLVQGPWPWLKVVLSCRPETWRSIKRPPVKLAKPFYYQEQGSDAAEVELEPYSALLEPFSRQELPQAYARYQQVYKLQTDYENLSQDVCRTLRDPFNLWLVASTYEEKTMPPTLKVSELVERYIVALVSTERLEWEDLQWLEKQLVPLMLRAGNYSNEITTADIDTVGQKLRLEINSEQVVRERRTNQAFINLLNADILVKQQQGLERNIAFKYERFYEYFVGKGIVQMRAGQANRASFFVELIEATSATPFLWGAVRYALVQEAKERGMDLLADLCFTDQQRVKGLLVNVLVYLGQDEPVRVETLLRRLVPTAKPAGGMQKIRQAMSKSAKVTDLRTRNAHKIAIEVASQLNIRRVLQAAALQSDPTMRAVAVRYSYYLWQHDRAAGFAVLDYLAQQATAGLVPNFLAFESVVGLSVIIFCDHYGDKAALTSLQGIWHAMITKLFRVREGGRLVGDFIRERIISFAVTVIFRLFGQLPAYNMVSLPALEAFFQLKATDKALYRRLVHYFDVDGDYSREQMEQDYFAVLRIDNVLLILTTLIGLVAHACSAPHAFLPFLRQLFEAARSNVATYPYLAVINNVAIDALDRDPMNDDMFDFLKYTAEVCRECYTRHPEMHHNRNAEAPQVLCTAPYILYQYQRTKYRGTGTVRTPWLEAPIQEALSQHNLTFFDILLTSELPQVAIEKQAPRAALATLEVFFKSGDPQIDHMIQAFLSRLRIYYPNEVEDFLEEQQASEEFRLQVRTREPIEKVGDLIAKRPWYFIRDRVLLGSLELRSELIDIFEKAADYKKTQAWGNYVIRHLVNLIYGGQVLRPSK